MKIYISLPISGHKIERCKERAEQHRRTLELRGHQVITPFDVCPEPDLAYAQYMGRDIEALLGCDAILMLAGWSLSRGCSLEWECAKIYRKKSFYPHQPNRNNSAMTIKGQITLALPETGGVSTKGNTWRKREYILETVADTYPKKIAFTVMGDNIDKFNIQPGQFLNVDIDLESREFNGRWYTTATAWRVTNPSIQQ